VKFVNVPYFIAIWHEPLSVTAELEKHLRLNTPPNFCLKGAAIPGVWYFFDHLKTKLNSVGINDLIRIVIKEKI
jgi:hypothetical protein